MAFNPFDFFRRNQRKFMAVIVVFVMFMFVLSFGRGDFFESLPRWLGSRRGGETVAVIDGSKVTTAELNTVETNRVLANTYMYAAAFQAAGNLQKYLLDVTDRVSIERRPLIQQFVQLRQGDYINPQLRQQAQWSQQFGIPGPTLDQLLNDRERTIAFLANRMNDVLADTGAKEDDRAAARAAADLLRLDVHLAENGRSAMYFTNQPNASERDRLDFVLWKTKAADLGIAFTKTDLDALLAAEFGNRLSEDDWKQAAASLGNKAGFTMDVLRAALADEFKVRAAQTAVLGASVVRGGPLDRAYDAPYDFFRFYQDQTAAAKFGVVAVPAQNFEPQVTGTPDEKELRDLFTKYRSVEPNPELPAPGLREPRRLKLGWLEAKGDEPFYKAAAADALPKVEAQTKVYAVLSGAVGHGSTLGVLAAVPLGNLSDPALGAAYQRTVDQFKQDLDGEWYTKAGNPFSSKYPPVDTSVAKPATLAAAAGGIAGNLLTGGSWLSAPLLAEQVVGVAEWKARANAFAPLLAPGGTVADRLAAVAHHLARLPAPLPLPAVRAKLVEEVKQDLARRLAHDDLEKFQKDLTALGEKLAKSEPAKLDAARAEAQAFAEKFIKDRGLKAGTSEAFHDQYTMGQDPGLAALKDKAAGPHGQAADLIQFGRRFFFEADPLNPRRPKPTAGLFKPDPYPFAQLIGPTETEPQYLVWRTAEQEGYSLKDFNGPGVKDKLVAAWKKLKARALAKAAAEDLAKQCENLGDAPATIYQNLRDKEAAFANRFPSLEAKARVKFFELDDVAPLVSSPFPIPGRDSVAPFMLPPGRDIPYPTLKMREQLLATRDKPLSATAVLVDNPEETYYVAVLMSRNERSTDTFVDSVYMPSLGSDLGLAIGRRHQDELAKKARDTAVALLKIEYGYEKENAALLDRKSGDGE